MLDRIPLEQQDTAPTLSLDGRLPLEPTVPDDTAPSLNGNGHAVKRHHLLHRTSWHQDLIRYPFIDMRTLPNSFVAPLPNGVPIYAFQCHLSRLCRQMEHVLSAAKGYGKNVQFIARRTDDGKAVRVKRVS